LVPEAHAEAAVQTVLEGVEFTRRVGVDLITFHAGFIPESSDDPVSGKLLDRLGRCADGAADANVRIGLESGQETAAALKQFLTGLDRENVGVNFDPANLILYGNQDPLEALPLLAGQIFQVHAKDGVWSDEPGVQWGQEVRLGEGDVQFARLVSKLRVLGYDGALIIEREAGPEPLGDIADGVEFLRSLQ
jgi:sugar phosphate isomerase/epimerase